MLSCSVLTSPGELAASHSANFNGDTTVNGADFLIWQRSYKSDFFVDHAGGDANHDSHADADDLVVWQQQYGKTFTTVDLSISKSASETSLATGQSVTYTITATNNASTDVASAMVIDVLPPQLTNSVWTAELTGVGTAMLSGIGDLHETIDLSAGSSITYTLTATLIEALTPNQPAQQIVTNAAHICAPIGTVDVDPTDNAALDADLITTDAIGGTGLFHSGLVPPYWGDLEYTLGDIDGDGDLDLFASDYDRFQILINDGQAGFTLASPSPSYGYLHAVGDLDQDGDLDIMLAVNGGQIVIQLNDGTGTFSANSDPLPIERVDQVEIADFDGDGDLDAVVNVYSDGIKLLWNDGNANFAMDPNNIINGYNGNFLHGDFDGDGDLDLIAESEIWINNGIGGFVSQPISADFGQYSAVQMGDIDNDKDLDLVVMGYDDFGQPSLVVWENDGVGGFTTESQASLQDYYGANFALGDLDGDGDLDAFLALGDSGNSIPDEVWLNDGNGNFTDSGQRLGNNASRAVAIGDLDGDGDLDALVTINGTDSEVPEVLYLNSDTDLSIDVTTGTATVTEGETVTYTVTVVNQGPAEVTGIAVVDDLPSELLNPTWTATLTGNGTANLAGVGDLNETLDLGNGSSIVYTISGELIGSLTLNQSVERFLYNSATVTAPAGVQESDLTNNRDIDSDIILLVATAGTAQFSGNSEGSAVGSERVHAVGDLDGDGDLDAVIDLGDHRAAVVLNDGSGVFGAPVAHFESVFAAAIGDMDNDGDLDLVFSASGYIEPVWLNKGNAEFEPILRQRQIRNGQLTLADFNNDGNLDILLYDSPEASPLRGIYFNDGSGGLAKALPLLARYEKASIGDVDGDGDIDIVTSHDSHTIATRILINDGTGNFTEADGTIGSDGPGFTKLGDLDGDGDLDAFVLSPSEIWLNDGIGNFSDSGQVLEVAPDSYYASAVGLGDLDGDGDLDAIVGFDGYYDAKQIWLNDGNGSFLLSANSIETTGNLHAKLGDLDGDGDLDAFDIRGYGDGDPVLFFNGTPIDLAISHHNNATSVLEGSDVHYFVEVTNLSDVDVLGARVEDFFDTVLLSNIHLDGIILQGNAISIQSPGPLSDSLFDTVDLPVGASITYEISATLIGSLTPNQGVEQTLTNTARVIAPDLPYEDMNLENNISVNTDQIVLTATAGTANFVEGPLLLQGKYYNPALPIAVGDVDGDGDLDVLVEVQRSSGSHKIELWLNDGTGQMVIGQVLRNGGINRGGTLGDFDGDGDLDALLDDSIWLNNGEGFFEFHDQKLDIYSNDDLSEFIDLDGDGDLDALMLSGTSGPLSTLINRGDGAFFNSEAISTALYWNSRRFLTLGDVDGDGDTDLWLGGEQIWINNGRGVFSPVDDAVDIQNNDASEAKFVDIDNDGDLDLISWDYPDSTIYENNGQGLFTYKTQLEGRSIATGDFDGDGDIDIESIGSSGSSEQRNWLWLNDGNGNFFPTERTLLGDSQIIGKGSFIGDFDGDGDLDILARTTHLWLNESLAPSADLDEDGEVNSQLATAANRPTEVIAEQATTSTALIDIAMALAWSDNSTKEESSFVAEQTPVDAILHVRKEHLGHVQATDPGTKIDSADSHPEKFENHDRPWLADELLEQVFD